MVSLREFQEALVQLISSGESLDGHESQCEVSGMVTRAMEGLDPGRLRLYMGDVAKRRFDLVKNCFGLTLKVLGPAQRKIVDSYWTRRISTGYNPGLELGSFPGFLHCECADANFPPYTVNLAEYEWMRRSVLCSSVDLPQPGELSLCLSDDWRGLRPVYNPTLQLKRFDYPVHAVASRVASGRWRRYSYAVVDNFLAVYQDPSARHELRVLELEAWSFEVLRTLVEQPVACDDLVELAIGLLPDQPEEETIVETVGMLRQLESLGVLLGFNASWRGGQCNG